MKTIPRRPGFADRFDRPIMPHTGPRRIMRYGILKQIVRNSLTAACRV